MSIVDHLSELRTRLVWVLGALALGTTLGWHYRFALRHTIQAPIAPYPLVFLKPAEALMVNMKIAFAAGVLFTLPILIYHTLAFCLPGSGSKLQKKIWITSALGTVFFAIGCAFGLTVALPTTLKFLLSFADPSLVPQLSVDYYFSFALGMTLVFGLTFELPLFMWMAGSLGLISHRVLRHNRKYAILILSIVAAILTPPDVVSQMLLLGPLLVLYEIGIWLVYVSQREGL